MASDKNTLLEQCKLVLDNNAKDGYTVPSLNLYPHQWLWDSCFIAIGLRHYDIKRAQSELLSLTKGIWQNGMLPNMIFGNDITNWDHRIWHSNINPNAPRSLATSGITQPPMLAIAVKLVGEKLAAKERPDWYRSMYESLVSYHSWLYKERSVNNDGLIALIHPYETGLDNSPPWISLIRHQQRLPWWIKASSSRKIRWLIASAIKNKQHVSQSERTNIKDSLSYFYLIQRLRRQKYDIEKIKKRPKFLVIDVGFNSILANANQTLIEIADEIKQPLPDELKESIKKTKESFNKFWDEDNKKYYSINLKTGKFIKKSSISELMPLFSGAISPLKASLLVDRIKDPKQYKTNYPIPSVPLSSPWFNDRKYWQGPTWLNTNWLIIKGLEDYGFNKEAKELAKYSIELVAKNGSSEYFSPLDGAPAGAKNFSWTASLCIDLLEDKSLS